MEEATDDDDDDTFSAIGLHAALLISKLTVEKIQERNVDNQRGRQDDRDKKTDDDDPYDRCHLAKIG